MRSSGPRARIHPSRSGRATLLACQRAGAALQPRLCPARTRCSSHTVQSRGAPTPVSMTVGRQKYGETQPKAARLPGSVRGKTRGTVGVRTRAKVVRRRYGAAAVGGLGWGAWRRANAKPSIFSPRRHTGCSSSPRARSQVYIFHCLETQILPFALGHRAFKCVHPSSVHSSLSEAQQNRFRSV